MKIEKPGVGRPPLGPAKNLLEEALYVIKSINSHSSLPNPLSLQEVQ
jgi:hypothetical protein